MAGMTRKRFLRYGGAGGAALFLPWTLRPPAASAAATGGKLSEVRPAGATAGQRHRRRDASGANHYEFTQTAITRQLHPDLPPTPLWAYDDGSGLEGQAGSFGMAVVAESGTPLDIDFTHDLPETYPAWLPVDTRLTPLGTEVRLMTHLHGGFVAARQRRQPGRDAERVRPRRDADGPLHEPAAARCLPRCSGSTTTASARPG